MVTEKQAKFKKWTMLLAILAFSLSLLGTFLVRSGVLTSVHAFASDPTRGFYILVYLGLAVGAALTVFAYKGQTLEEDTTVAMGSRTGLLLLNNLLLTVMCGTVLLGTTYPLLLEALHLGKISVGPPYFNTVMVPLAFALMTAMALVPVSHWSLASLKSSLHKIKWPLLLGLGLATGIMIFYRTLGNTNLWLGIGLAGWLIAGLIAAIYERWTQKRLYFRANTFWGMTVAHLGVAILVLGITVTSAFSVDKDVRFKLHSDQTVAGLRFVFQALEALQGPNYQGVKGTFEVYQGEKRIAVLHPEKRTYAVQQMALSETAIDPSVWRDIYIALGTPLSADEWAVRIYYKPLVRWLWLGGLFMIAGGILSVLGLKRKFND